MEAFLIGERLLQLPEITTDETERAYNPRLDYLAAQKLEKERPHLTEEDYRQKVDNLLRLTKTNLITSLAERLMVESHRATYTQKGDEIYHDDYYPDTPFREIVSATQKLRENAGSKEVEREKAEAQGFEMVTKMVADSDPTTYVVMISPRGDKESIYGHNFFDVYHKNTDGKINMSRFMSNANPEEFAQAAKKLCPNFMVPPTPTDADFLKTPFTTKEDLKIITKTLNQDNETMSHDEFKNVTSLVSTQVDKYLKTLKGNPNANQLEFLYTAIINSADIASGRHQKFTPEESAQITARLKSHDTDMLTVFLASQPVGEIKTACGRSTRSLFRPFTVSEFTTSSSLEHSGTDQFGTLEINCAECGASYQRTPGKLEQKCRRCGGTKGIVC